MVQLSKMEIIKSLKINLRSLEKNSLEPNSPSPKDRLEALKEAHSLGIKTFISIEPWIPKITNPISILMKL
jgi:DNA repair photolyase